MTLALVTSSPGKLSGSGEPPDSSASRGNTVHPQWYLAYFQHVGEAIDTASVRPDERLGLASCSNLIIATRRLGGSVEGADMFQRCP